MATTFFLRDTSSSLAIASEDDLDATLTAGSALVAKGDTNTVAGPTAGVQLRNNSESPFELMAWYTQPLDAVTITGTVTFNVWMAENNMSANVAARMRAERTDGSGSVISEIATAQHATEIAVTTRAVRNFTATPTSTTLSAGDRIRITILGDDAGTMASGFSFNASYGSGSAGTDGDTFVTFTETITEFTAAAERVPFYRPHTQLLAH